MKLKLRWIRGVNTPSPSSGAVVAVKGQPIWVCTTYEMAGATTHTACILSALPGQPETAGGLPPVVWPASWRGETPLVCRTELEAQEAVEKVLEALCPGILDYVSSGRSSVIEVGE